MLARIKVGDTVEVISGKDKKARGVVLALSQDKTKVKVKGVALTTSFDKAKKVGAGSLNKGIVVAERFIHACKVMPICPQTNKPCRVKVVLSADGGKVRVSARSGLKI